VLFHTFPKKGRRERESEQRGREARKSGEMREQDNGSEMGVV